MSRAGWRSGLGAGVVALALAACGGGSGARGDGAGGISPGVPDVEPEQLAGVWGGEMQGPGGSQPVRMAFLDGGAYWLWYGVDDVTTMAVTGFVQGRGDASGSDFVSRDGRDFGLYPAAPAALEIRRGSTLAGVLRTDGLPDVALSATRLGRATHDDSVPATLAAIVGLWPMRTIDGRELDVTIGLDGTLTGVDRYRIGANPACRLDGRIQPAAVSGRFFEFVVQFGPAPCPLPYWTVAGIGIDSAVEGTALRELVLLGIDDARTAGEAFHGVR